ncbi:hypothetical protein FRC18_005571 [Serendipita sp. 400]|nr:hypothetical protein FRC18_005571 [Serendipita sp. 400]
MVSTHSFLYKLPFVFGLVIDCYVNQAWAFKTTLPSSTTQCGPYTVTWGATESKFIEPPFELSIIPVNGPQASSADAGGLGPAGLSLPIVTTIPDTAFNVWEFQNGRSAAEIWREIIFSGLGTSGLSNIQTASSNAQGSGHLPDQNANSNVPFTLSTPAPTTCQAITITSGPIKAICDFIPGSTPFSLDVDTAGGTSVTTECTINVPASTSFVLLYEGSTGVVASSGLITVGSGSCPRIGNGPQSMASGGSASASSSNISSRSSSSSPSSSASHSLSPGSSMSSTSASTTVGSTGGSGNGTLRGLLATVVFLGWKANFDMY